MLWQRSASQMAARFLSWLLPSWRQPPQPSRIAPSLAGWNCLKMQLRFAQWQLASWEDGSCWQAYHFHSSDRALGCWFWSATSPLFPLQSLPWYVACNRVQGFQDRLNCGCSPAGAWDTHPAFPASTHRDLAPRPPSGERAGARRAWECICNEDALVTS